MLKKIPKRVAEHCLAAILKNETELRAAYATYRGNNPGNNKRARQGRYQEINKALYKWYSLARECISKRSIEGESADYIDANDMVPFCREPIDLSNEEWRSLLRNEVLSTKTDENAEPEEKINCLRR